MFIELIDLLRCPEPHRESSLVAAFSEMRERFVIEARLGCPECGASYAISAGVADFTGQRAPDRFLADDRLTSPGDEADDEEAGYRTAAMLGLSRPGSLVVLDEYLHESAARVAMIAEAQVIVVNPSVAVEDTERVAVVLSRDRVPLGIASADAVASSRIVEGARLLRSGGRLVAPAATHLGTQFVELARDDAWVVAERVSELIPISVVRNTSRR